MNILVTQISNVFVTFAQSRFSCLFPMSTVIIALPLKLRALVLNGFATHLLGGF